MKAVLFSTILASISAADFHHAKPDLDHFDLKLVLEVTRHGQRAPEKIYNLAAHPEDNFSVPHNLTHTGAFNHHATGGTIREMLDELDPNFLSQAYEPDEIYVQTTCSARCIDSAIAQLEGLYGLDLQFPNADDQFDLTTIKCQDDQLLRMNRDMCPRLKQVRHAVAAEIATALMYDEISYDEERSGFLEHLRHLSGEEGQSIHHMHLVCDYVYWAKESHIELSFEMNDEEYRRCLIAKEKGSYAEFLASEELTALPIHQLMRQLSELASIVKGDLDWHNAEVLNEYMDRDTFPKFMLYSTHQETIAPLLGAFKNILLIDPAPASSVFFWFFEYRHHGEDEPQLAVKVSFSETPWDRDSHKSLIFVSEQESGPAFISIDRFREYVEGRLASWDHMIGEGDIDKKCYTPYQHMPSGQQGYYNPNEFRWALYHYFGIEHAIRPKFLQQ